jgi:hypothetical protein
LIYLFRLTLKEVLPREKRWPVVQNSEVTQEEDRNRSSCIPVKIMESKTLDYSSLVSLDDEIKKEISR